MLRKFFDFTHDSLATIIAWLSTCLLAGGMSMLFSEHTRWVWLGWGSFGLASALGLDVAARMRLRKQNEQIERAVENRFARDFGGVGAVAGAAAGSLRPRSRGTQ